VGAEGVCACGRRRPGHSPAASRLPPAEGGQ
jgi:hypothetical protein